MFTLAGMADSRDKLQMLWLTDVQYGGDPEIQGLSSDCRQISVLALRGLTTFPPTAFFKLFADLPSLTEVAVVMCQLDDDALSALAGNGQNLRLLDLSHSVGYSSWALSVLASNCAALSGVCVEPDNPVVTEGVRAFWKAWRPDLRIVHDSAKLGIRWM